ncbi:MAG: hypothetical protein LIQ30_07840 [Planctomycetes bacterium]|nr:hypothetical protein [Planctomycetota bacterium]MCD7896971.1 hypothetical protein [Planctomycetaceae bacterium]
MAKAIVPAVSHTGSTGAEDKVYEYGYYDKISTGKDGVEVNTADIHTAIRSAGAVSNPNILINTDFRNIINQRGYGGGTVGVGTYTFDRWRNNAGSQKHEIIDGALRATCTAAGDLISIAQKIDVPQRFAGKQLTVSCMARLSATAGYLHLYDGVTYAPTTIPHDGVWHRIVETKNIGDSTTMQLELRCGAFNGTVRVGDFIEVKDVKIEEGPVATPWIAPDPAEELLRCQRYCVVFGGAHSTNYPDLAHGYVIVNNASTATAQFTIPRLNLRAKPACKTEGDFHLYAGADFNANLILDATKTLVFTAIPSHTIRCQLNAPPGFLPALGRPITIRSANVNPGKFIFDAEI